MDAVEAFGKVLKKYHGESKVTQEELALSCGLDRTYIGLLERAKRQPTISTIFKIADVLGVEPHVMIEDVEQLVFNRNSEEK